MIFHGRMRWLLLSAIPFVLLSIPVLWILHRYLQVRDLLGMWHLHLEAADGTEVGHGQVTFTAKSWSWSIDWRHADVHFSAHFNDYADAGTLTLTPKATSLLVKAFDETWDEPNYLLKPVGLGDSGGSFMIAYRQSQKQWAVAVPFQLNG